MAKASSPIRLQQQLMQAAELAASRHHRSTAEQIEYWAELGQAVAATLDPDVLLAIKAGIKRLRVESVVTKPINPESVFETLEAKRQDKTLQQSIPQSPKALPGIRIPPRLSGAD